MDECPHTQTHVLLAGVMAHPAPTAPLNREGGTLPELHAALLDWPVVSLTITRQLFQLYLFAPFLPFFSSTPFPTLAFVFSVVSSLPCCNHMPQITTSSSDCPFVYIYPYLSVSIIHSWRQPEVVTVFEQDSSVLIVFLGIKCVCCKRYFLADAM